MRFNDKLKYAWHSIIKNKSRSFFTAFIIFFISTIVILLLSISTSFYKNEKYLLQSNFSEEQLYINLSGSISSSNYSDILNVLNDYSKNIKMVSSGRTSKKYTSFYYLSSSGIELYDINGSLNDYTNTASVIVPINEKENNPLGNYINLDDMTYKVIGYSNSSQYYFSLEYYLKTSKVNNLFISFYSNDSDVFLCLKMLKNISKELKNVISIKEIDSPFIEKYNNVVSLANWVLIVMVLISIIMLFVTIGCISNSIIISLDENKHFYAMIKSIGARSETLYHIILLEFFILIIISSLFSFLAVYIFSPIIKNIVIGLTEVFLDGFYISKEAVIFSIPIYLPIISSILIACFIVVFCRIIIRQVINSNPVDLLSEVN
ncbi:MAG: FtsX-like permease family protein [Anaeroplasma sp.]